jgi:ligand-binding sensor domain-containing protein
MRYLEIVLALLAIFNSTGVSWGDGKWTNYTTADGLANDIVFSIAIDTLGVKWFGTKAGVSRFDGSTWKTYTTANGLANNNVLSIAIDGDGVKWFGTTGGVSRFDGSAWKTYTTADGLAGNYDFSIVKDAQGVKWFGTASGVSRFDGSTWKTYTTVDGLNYNDVRSVAVDTEGVKWFGTWGGGVSSFDGSTWKTYTTVDGLTHNVVHSITTDAQGVKWFGTKEGVSRFDGSTWKTYTTSDSLAHNTVHSIAIDGQGVKWFGTWGGGVSRFDGLSWKTYTTTDGLADNVVNSIAIDAQGVKWFGTNGGGVSKFEEKAAIHSADFNNDGFVSLADLVILGSKWGLISTNSNYEIKYDLNKDGTIGLADLVILGGQWTGSGKVAKTVPTAGVTLDLTAKRNAASSMFYVNVSTKDATDIDGLAFSLKYDPNLFEFVKDSVSGLGTISVTNEAKAGVIDIASVYKNEKFTGTVSLGFKAKNKTGDMNVRMMNAEVALNGVLSSINDKTIALKIFPEEYALFQNSPNPFNLTTIIQYTIPGNKEVSVQLNIYDSRGALVKKLVNDSRNPGLYSAIWNTTDYSGRKVSSDIYFYKLDAGSFTQTKKMLLLR